MATTRKPLSEAQLAQIPRLYAEGRTMESLAHDFGCSPWKIQSVINSSAIPTRPRGNPKRLPSPDDHAVRKLYEAGHSSTQIARLRNVSERAINSAIKRAGGMMRSSSEAHALAAPRTVNPQLAQALLARHAAGESCRTIASSIGVDHKVVASAIRYAGGQTRSRSDAVQLRRHDISAQTFDRLTALHPLPHGRWLFQCSCGNLHKTLSDPVVRGLAKSCGCLRTGGDTLDQAIEGTLRNLNDTAEFYIYALASHPNYLKPGIDSTGTRPDAQYGEQLLSIQLPRIEAWLLEQAVLADTRPLAAFPADLQGWTGYTELRRIDPDTLINVASALHDQLLDLGRWEFALRFVPMTTQQVVRAQALAAATA
jgi:hypothetical protein